MWFTTRYYGFPLVYHSFTTRLHPSTLFRINDTQRINYLKKVINVLSFYYLLSFKVCILLIQQKEFLVDFFIYFKAFLPSKIN